MDQSDKWNCLFPAVILGICFIHFFGFIFGIKVDQPLYGVSVDTEKPTATWKGILSGSYQETYQNWFAEHIPFRSYGIKGHAQWMTTFCAPVNGIEIGRNKNLYEEYFTQATLEGGMDEQVLQQYIEDLVVIDQALKQEKKWFVYLISPSKAEVYPEDLPWNKRLLWKQSDNPAWIRKALRTALADKGLPFLDFTDFIKQLKEEGEYPAFYKTGIHWSPYAVAKASLFLCDYFNQTFGLCLPEMEPRFTRREEPQFDEEDIKKITNAFWLPFDQTYCLAELLLKQGVPQNRVFAVSTSFTHGMLSVFAQNKMPFAFIWRTQYSQFQDKLYYNEEGAVVWEGFLPGCSFGELNYADIFYGSDMVWVESNAPEIPESHIQFASEFAAYIQRNTYIADYIEELYQREDIAVIITSNNYSKLLLNSKQKEAIALFGLPSLEENETLVGIWENQTFQLVEEDSFSGRLGTEPYTISRSKNQGKRQTVITYNEQQYTSDIGGLNFFVYDKKENQVVDWVIFDLNNSAKIYR